MEILKVKQLENGYLANDVILIPNDERNKDYQAVQEWVNDGGVIEPEFTTQELADNELEKAKSENNTTYVSSVSELTAGVPDVEQATWTKQENEARAYLVDNTASTPFIDSLSAARDIPKDYLVSKIIEKADLYAVALGTLTGTRQKVEDEMGV